MISGKVIFYSMGLAKHQHLKRSIKFQLLTLEPPDILYFVSVMFMFIFCSIHAY